MVMEDEVLSMLRDVVKILDKHNITFWVSHGALLGWYRDGHLIPWDKDVDLNIMSKDRKRIMTLKGEFNEKGFKVKSKTTGLIILKEGITFSVGFWEKYGENVICTGLAVSNKRDKIKFFKRIMLYGLIYPLAIPELGGFLGKLPYGIRKRLYEICFVFGIKCIRLHIRKRTQPIKIFSKLKEIDFLGIKLKAPEDIDGHLLYTYGKDWMIPVSKYSNAFATNRINFDFPYKKGMEKYEERFSLCQYKK